MTFRTNKIPLDWESTSPARKLVNTGSQFLKTAGTVAHGIGTGDFCFSVWTAVQSGSADNSMWANGTYAPLLGCKGGANGFRMYWTAYKTFATQLVIGRTTHVLVQRKAGTLEGWVDGKKDANTFDISSLNMLNAVQTLGSSTAAGTDYYSGKIQWPCLWRASLSAREILTLKNARPPWEVRPNKIVFCPDLQTLYDPFARYAWTNAGTTLVNPLMRVIRPRHTYFAPEVATGNRRRRVLISMSN